MTSREREHKEGLVIGLPVQVERTSDLLFHIGRAGTVLPPTHLATAAYRLRGVDADAAAQRPTALQEPFLKLAEVLHLPGQTCLTVRIGVRGGVDDPSVLSDFVVAGVGGEDVGGEVSAAHTQISRILGGPDGPYAIDPVPLDELDWPTAGHGAFIRQQSLRIEGSDDGFDLPLRFTRPGRDAPGRLLQALLAAGPGTDLFVSATPTILDVAERRCLAGAMLDADRARGSSTGAIRDLATVTDLSLSFRTDLYVLQVFVSSPDPLAEVTLRAIGSSLTAPFDAERGPGIRVVSPTNRFVGGGFDIEPSRDPTEVLARLRHGTAWIGFRTERELVDISTSTELSYCLRWITKADGTLPGVASSRGAAPQVAERADTVRLGTDASGRRVVIGGHDRNLHCAVIGASGSGKTSLLAHLASQDIDAGRGVFVVDPHGDLCDRVLAAVPAKRRQDVHVLDGRDGELERLNLLRVYRPDSHAQRDVIAALLEAMVVDLNKDFAGPVFQRTASRLLRLAGISGGTMLDLEDYVAEPALALELALASGVDELVTFAREMGAWSESYRAELSNWSSSKLEWLRLPGLARTFASPTSTFDLPAALAEQHIVLVYPGDEVGSSRVAMSVLMGATLRCLGDRDTTSPSISMYLDEVQRYCGAVMRRMLNETRKRAISLHLATQNLTNVAEHVEAVLGNTGTLLIGRSQGATAAFAAEHLEIPAPSVGRLPNFRAIARVPVDGVPSEPFELLIPRPTDPPVHGLPDWVTGGR